VVVELVEVSDVLDDDDELVEPSSAVPTHG